MFGNSIDTYNPFYYSRFSLRSEATSGSLCRVTLLFYSTLDDVPLSASAGANAEAGVDETFTVGTKPSPAQPSPPRDGTHTHARHLKAGALNWGL